MASRRYYGRFLTKRDRRVLQASKKRITRFTRLEGRYDRKARKYKKQIRTQERAIEKIVKRALDRRHKKYSKSY